MMNESHSMKDVHGCGSNLDSDSSACSTHAQWSRRPKTTQFGNGEFSFPPLVKSYTLTAWVDENEDGVQGDEEVLGEFSKQIVLK